MTGTAGGLAVLILAIVLAAGLIAYYLDQMSKDLTRERLRAGLEDAVPERVSLWRDAADLLQLARARRLLEQSPLARVLERRLRQLSITYSLSQVLLGLTALISAAAGAAYAASSRAPVSVAAALAVPLLLWWLLKSLAERRVYRLESQLAGLINQMITTLQSGGMPLPALRVASQNTPPPLGPSIAGLVQAIALGVPPNRAWRDWGRLWGSRGCFLLSQAMRLKWEAGGEMTSLLTVILDQVEGIRRRELRIRQVTALARISAYILASLPLLLGTYTYFINPILFWEMVNDPLGRRALLATGGLLLVGFIWMRRIARLEA